MEENINGLIVFRPFRLDEEDRSPLRAGKIVIAAMRLVAFSVTIFSGNLKVRLPLTIGFLHYPNITGRLRNWEQKPVSGNRHTEVADLRRNHLTGAFPVRHAKGLTHRLRHPPDRSGCPTR